MTNYVLCGMAFGDEGKGSFVDFLAHEFKIKNNVKYNGGSHAGHSVMLPNGQYHKFSQLGSGMFLSGSQTYLTQNTVVNPINICEEVRQFAPKIGLSEEDIFKRIFIHPDCYCVTRYHKLTNKLRELSRGKNRLSSFGTGVSEVMFLAREVNIFVRFENLYEDFLIHKLNALRDYLISFYKENSEAIYENIPDDVAKYIGQEMEFLSKIETPRAICDDFRQMVLCSPWRFLGDKEFYKQLDDNEPAIYEGSQGLLLDVNVGLRPNTTQLDTTNHFAMNMLQDKQKNKVGIIKAYASRHGFGVFPTADTQVDARVTDQNQESAFWNGSIKFGWFDAVLMRYAQKFNQVDQLYLSSLDKMSKFPVIKICKEYRYTGAKDAVFESLFDYVESYGDIIVRDIKKADENLAKYLEQCQPVYVAVDGWMKNISKIRKYENLPSSCKNYILLLEKLTKIPISVVSVGATREDKIRLI